MKYEFEKVIDGILAYMNEEIYPRMNEWQNFVARTLVGRMLNSQEYIKHSLINNGFIRTLNIIDSEGMIDVDSLLNDIKNEMHKCENLSLNIPMFGKLTFKASDVDVLHQHITGGTSHESY